MMRQGVGTRSLAAAVAGGAGGGGPYASLNRHQYHRQNPPRSAVGGNVNNSSSNQAGGGYVNTHTYHQPAGGGGGGGGGVGREGAAVSAAAFAAASSIGGSRNSWSQQLDQLRTDDVIPTPLEIHSPGGGGDILSLSCLGSYLVDVKLPSNLDGAGGDGTGQQGTFSAAAAGEMRSGGGSGGGGGDAGAAGESSSEGTAEMKGSSSGGGGGGGGDRGGQPGQLMSDPSKGTSTSSGEWSRRNRPPSTAPTPAAAAAAAATTGDNGGDVKRHAPDSSQRLGRMNIVTGDGGGDRGGGGSDDDDGGGNGGGAALFDANAAALQHDMQALSIDDEPSPGWSQLRTDVAGVPGPAFDGDALPMSLTSASDNVLGGAQGFPVPPAFKSRSSRLSYPPATAGHYAAHVQPPNNSCGFSANLPPTPGFAASPRTPMQQQHPYPMFAAAVGPSPSRGAVLSGTGSRGMSPFPLAPPAPAGAIFGPASGGAAPQQHNSNSSNRANRSVSRSGNDFQQRFLGMPQAGPPAPAGTTGAAQSLRSDNNNGDGHDHGHRGPAPYGGAVLQQQEQQQPQYLHEGDQSQGQPIFNISNINVPGGGQPFPSGPPSFPPPTSSSSLPRTSASAAAAAAGAVAMNVNAVDIADDDAKTERNRSRSRGEPNAGGRGVGRSEGGSDDNRIGIATAESAAKTATTAGAPPTPSFSSSFFAGEADKAVDPHET
ncbi:unnamed protein product, partial [Ectocarpus sp. 8 AP-2014]